MNLDKFAYTMSGWNFLSGHGGVWNFHIGTTCHSFKKELSSQLLYDLSGLPLRIVVLLPLHADAVLPQSFAEILLPQATGCADTAIVMPRQLDVFAIHTLPHVWGSNLCTPSNVKANSPSPLPPQCPVCA